MMTLNERGAVFPSALLVCMISLYAAAAATDIYIAEYRYVKEMQDYYKEKGTALLLEAPLPGSAAEERDEMKRKERPMY